MSHIDDISAVPIETEALDAVPEPFARALCILPVSVSKSALHIIASTDADNSAVIVMLQSMQDWTVIFDTGDRSAIEAAIDQHYPTPSQHELNAVWEMAERKDKQYIPALTQALDYPNQAVRGAAVAGLCEFGPEGREIVEKKVLPKLRLTNDWERINAINIVGQIQSDKAIPQLIDLLGVKDLVGVDGVIEYPCQFAAAEALAKIGHLALPALTAAFHSPNAEMRKHAARAAILMTAYLDGEIVVVDRLAGNDAEIRGIADMLLRQLVNRNP